MVGRDPLINGIFTQDGQDRRIKPFNRDGEDKGDFLIVSIPSIP
jgi:hypothetical protein